jgi:hypothetical protein
MGGSAGQSIYQESRSEDLAIRTPLKMPIFSGSEINFFFFRSVSLVCTDTETVNP